MQHRGVVGCLFILPITTESTVRPKDGMQHTQRGWGLCSRGDAPRSRGSQCSCVIPGPNRCAKCFEKMCKLLALLRTLCFSLVSQVWGLRDLKKTSVKSFRCGKVPTQHTTGNMRLRKGVGKGWERQPGFPSDTADLDEFRGSTCKNFTLGKYFLKLYLTNVNNALQYSFSNSYKGIRCYYYLVFYFPLTDETLISLACDYHLHYCMSSWAHTQHKLHVWRINGMCVPPVWETSFNVFTKGGDRQKSQQINVSK